MWMLLAVHGWELAALFAWLWWQERQRPKRRSVPVPLPEAAVPGPPPVNAPRPEELSAVKSKLRGVKAWAGRDEQTLDRAAAEIAARGREYLATPTTPRAQ